MIAAKKTTITAVKTGEFEATKGKIVTAKGTAATGTGTKTTALTTVKAGEFEAAEVAKAKVIAGKGTVIKGTTAAGKTTLVGKNIALTTSKPVAKGVLTVATKSAAATGVGLSVSTWGPILLAGILIASGTGIYLYLKKRGMMGELEEVST